MGFARIFHEATVAPNFLDRLVWANSADPEEQSYQGLYCLQYCVHLFEASMLECQFVVILR